MNKITSYNNLNHKEMEITQFLQLENKIRWNSVVNLKEVIPGSNQFFVARIRDGNSYYIGSAFYGLEPPPSGFELWSNEKQNQWITTARPAVYFFYANENFEHAELIWNLKDNNDVDNKIQFLDWLSNYYRWSLTPNEIPSIEDRVYDGSSHFPCMVEKKVGNNYVFHGFGYCNDQSPNYCSYVAPSDKTYRFHRAGSAILEKPDSNEKSDIRFIYLLKPVETTMDYITNKYYNNTISEINKCKKDIKLYKEENIFFKKRKELRKFSYYIKWLILFIVSMSVLYFRMHNKGNYKTPKKHRVASLSSSLAFIFIQIALCFLIIFGLSLAMDIYIATSLGSIIWMIYVIFYISSSQCIYFAR
jgi:hypothetical protein